MAHTNLYQARILGTLHGQQTVNVLHFAGDANPADNAALVALLVQLATAILQCVTSTLIGGISEDWTCIGVDAKQIKPTPSDPQLVAAGAGTIGGRGTTNVSFVAALVNIRTGLGGKRGRGRIFLPPPGDADQTNSVLSDTSTGDFYRSFLTCLAGKFIGSGHTEPQVLGVFSHKDDTSGNPFPASFRDATVLTLNQTMAVMRSRKVGHGG